MPAEYALIKYVSDPARNEPRNVGIVLWDGETWELQIDRDAARRVATENPHLAPDAILVFEQALRYGLKQAEVRSRDDLTRILAQFNRLPVSITDLRVTTLDETIVDPSQRRAQAIEALLKRLVRPRRRGGGSTTAEDILERLLKPWMRQGKVVRRYLIPQSRSGVPRSVDFFINGGRNVAIDALNLNLKRAREIVERADAEANKIRDVLEAGGGLRFIVFYVPNPSSEMHEVTEQAVKILRAADVEATADEQRIESLVAAEL
jgi:hypothetical protein